MNTRVSHTWGGGRKKGKKGESSHVETVFALKARSSFPGILPQRESTSALLFLLIWLCIVSDKSRRTGLCLKQREAHQLPCSEKRVHSLFAKRDLINMSTAPQGLYTVSSFIWGWAPVTLSIRCWISLVISVHRGNRQRVQVMAKF